MEKDIKINEGLISTCNDDYLNAMSLVKEKLNIYLEEPKVFSNEYVLGTPGFKDNLRDNLKRALAIIFDFVAVYKKYEVNENIKNILEKARNIYSILEEALVNINEDVLKSLREIRAIEFK
ncbi:hypothetical protein ACSXC4_00465 [Clostridium perfringens]|uniref:Uncharacterized protein n=1 Tax=Clostridium perfringens TaxID=1502 RepID=A0A127EG44_CLOPF|nr:MULTISPECIES: hypothetical protein [Clostridium]AMN34909.1 hypothetical protein JFP838_03805 [Clostridium perfringens]EGT3607558.1 hypothetical protein [Clostridium perfringens]EGT4138887.1 hypothetical protein [Clostridium perfringens]EJT6341805.1 hypothetical protein [Clostridium perfringens]ELQ0172989.1 hypothetical protein [Clostridium perfringens]